MLGEPDVYVDDSILGLSISLFLQTGCLINK